LNHNSKLLQEIKKNLRGTVLIDEALARHTSFKIGGPADFYVIPNDEADLLTLLGLCQSEGIPRFIIGKGTNLLVSDEGFRGIVIDLSRACRNFRIEDSVVVAGAGILIDDLITRSIASELSGGEELSGIPGSIGGAVILNAGAFDTEIKDLLTSVKLVDVDNRIKNVSRSQIVMQYRWTDISPDAVLLEASFNLKPGIRLEIEQIRTDILACRQAKQPLSLPSAGSVFKRPPGDYAGRLIEEAGLKGLRIGDAMVSEKHANFIVNCGTASASDVYRLITEIQEVILKRFDVSLEPEIRLLGF
jgi:UDP-N-acetylmuramate dehydrogenase